MFLQKGGENIAMESQQGGGGGGGGMVKKTKQKKQTGTPHKCFRTNGFKFAVLAFTKRSSNLTIHIQMDNKVALSCLLKMGRVHTV